MNQAIKARDDRIRRATRLWRLHEDKKIPLSDLAEAEGCSKQRIFQLIATVRPKKHTKRRRRGGKK